MFECPNPECKAGPSRLRVIAASPVKMEVRRIFLRCVDCDSQFTIRGNGVDFNVEVLRVGNNPRRSDG